MPAKTQIDSLSGGSSSTAYVGSYSPVLGGYYYNSTLRSESTNGLWWSSMAVSDSLRCRLYYDGNKLYSITSTSGGSRNTGFYVRCIQAS
ncbi:hypothetical protein IJG93_02980 [Candidatus Saccharibacteria bacterium]|nr:hypothetical protein [Candidatus Saccharibacteria bacterium]